jgi:hypothetical protein
MFNSWLSNQSKKIRRVIWVGVAAVCWAIWRCRNDLIFNKIKVNSVLQVIFRGTYWFRFWAQLQREEHAKNTFSSLSRLIEIVALDLVKGGCEHVYRLHYFGVSLVTGVFFFLFSAFANFVFFLWLCMPRHRGRIGNPLSKKKLFLTLNLTFYKNCYPY